MENEMKLPTQPGYYWIKLAGSSNWGLAAAFLVDGKISIVPCVGFGEMNEDIVELRGPIEQPQD